MEAQEKEAEWSTTEVDVKTESKSRLLGTLVYSLEPWSVPGGAGRNTHKVDAIHAPILCEEAHRHSL